MTTTPGPWIVDQFSNADGNALIGNFYAVRCGNDRSKIIAITGRISHDIHPHNNQAIQNECIANTTLIASAPDMLDALIAVQEELQEALGEWFGVEPPYIPEHLMSHYRMMQTVSQAFEKIHAEAE